MKTQFTKSEFLGCLDDTLKIYASECASNIGDSDLLTTDDMVRILKEGKENMTRSLKSLYDFAFSR